MGKREIVGFLLAEIPNHPNDIVRVASNNFGISPQGIHRHLKGLIERGLVKKSGRTKSTTYSLPNTKHGERRELLQVALKDPARLDEHVVWDEKIVPILPSLRENVRAICEFGVTEILNNAKDHSEAQSALLTVSEYPNGDIEFRVTDIGVGIFQKIRTNYKLETNREAILELSKGKVTTDPERHSGQGIFFTSRAFDRMTILSSGLSYVRFNEEDWLLDQAEWHPGTSVTMLINLESKTILRTLFEKYAGEENDYSFAKTQVAVALAADESFVSRSQGKRIVAGLEKFKTVVLDFKRVSTVGQGFVDEVFRVFAKKFPNIRIAYVNANENVEFMIKRSLTEQTTP